MEAMFISLCKSLYRLVEFFIMAKLIFCHLIKNDFNNYFCIYMMIPLISCFYFRRHINSFKFIFIDYDFFIKVIINCKSVIITKKELTLNPRLFQLYLVSLLLTEDMYNIKQLVNNDDLSKKPLYYINTNWYMCFNKKNMELTKNTICTILPKNKNPLNDNYPKRSSSYKKIKKLIKLIDSFYIYYKINDISFIISEYINNETKELVEYFNRYDQYKNKIEILSAILHNYGSDIYTSINKFI